MLESWLYLTQFQKLVHEVRIVLVYILVDFNSNLISLNRLIR